MDVNMVSIEIDNGDNNESWKLWNHLGLQFGGSWLNF
jgi:hypothetical protein